MDKLLAKLSEQQAAMREQSDAMKGSEDDFLFARVVDQPSTGSLPLTPANDAFSSGGPTTRPASATANDSRATTEELLRLKLELAQAQNKISRLDQELAQSRLIKPESGRVTPVISPDAEYSGISGLDQASSGAPGMPAAKTHLPRDSAWPTQDDCRTDTVDVLSTGGFARSRSIWGNGKTAFQSSFLAGSAVPVGDGASSVSWSSGRSYGSSYADAGGPSYGTSSSGMDGGYRADRLQPDQDAMVRPSSGRRANRYDNRFGSPNSFGGGYGGYSSLSQSQYDQPVASYSTIPTGPMSNGMGANVYPQYQQQPVGTALSPHATEFTSTAGPAWKTEVRTRTIHTTRRDPRTDSTPCPDYSVRGSDVSTHDGAAQLPPSPGPQRQLQLEVHRRQDRL